MWAMLDEGSNACVRRYVNGKEISMNAQQKKQLNENMSGGLANVF